MEKIVDVNGMHCEHCQASVEKALMAVAGVESAKVSLDDKIATVTLNGNVDDSLLLAAVNDAGFEAVGVRA